MTSYETDIGVDTVRSIQFENVNEGRSYPFSDNADLTSTDGKTLPEELVADARLIIPAGRAAYLSSAYVSTSLVSLCVRVMEGTVPKGALSVTVARDVMTPYVPYRLEPLSGSEDMGGIVTFGNLGPDGFNGTYRFADGQVRFASAAVAGYVPSGLRKIVDDRTGESLSGDVRIEFPNYVAAEQVVDSDGTSVRLYLKEGAGKALMSGCDKKRAENACGATPISSINGISPDEKNRIVLWFH